MSEHDVITVLRFITAFTSLSMILSPTPAVYQIFKTHEIGHTSIISLVGTLGNCTMWTTFGFFEGNYFPVVATFGSGVLISHVYISIYYKYTPERAYVRKVYGFAVSFLLCVVLYAVLGATGVTGQTRTGVRDVIGYAAVCVTLILYGSPFEKVRQVLKYKSAVFIPIHMVCAGSTNNAFWIVYTYLDKDWFLFVTNAACFVLGMGQLTLYFIYNPKRCPVPENYGKEDDHTMISIAQSPREVHLVRSSINSAAITHPPESPSYQVIHSPLAPLHT
uniref:Bidirectional sugar transporter SWEET n=1 Tax=Globisporangium ultimum (strain ATCC 200006 / CBS 805.95 / DAOM BR144) TaxID=431595 RepID=K3X1W3_GLOUD